jgi:integrase
MRISPEAIYQALLIQASGALKRELLTEAVGRSPGPIRAGWPTRDVTIIDLLAHCGLRASELRALSDNNIDVTGERPLLRLRFATKGGAAHGPAPPHHPGTDR